MLRSFYIAGTGMLTQRSKMDIIINNITNSDTVGYKKDQVISRSFGDMLLDRLNDPSVLTQTYVGGQNTGVYVDELSTDFKQGPIEPTEQQSDLAITGDGFFSIQTPNGVRYTRSGNFQVDANGTLLTQEGYYVMGQNGGMINVGTGDFTVKGDGTVFVNGQAVNKIQVVQFADTGVLRKAGDNLYYPNGGAQPQVMNNPSITQGALEGSNTEIGREMADMLMTNRAYESSQRILKMVDESLAKTVSEIGRF